MYTLALDLDELSPDISHAASPYDPLPDPEGPMTPYVCVRGRRVTIANQVSRSLQLRYIAFVRRPDGGVWQILRTIFLRPNGTIHDVFGALVLRVQILECDC